MANLPFLLMIIALGVLALVGMVVCFIYILRQIFIKKGKLIELMNAYPIGIVHEVMVFYKQTIGLGKSLRFRKCTRVCISKAGLYLAIKVILGKTLAVFIPWNEFSHVTETRFYGLNAFCFSIGSPEITSIKIYPALFAKIKPYLQG